MCEFCGCGLPGLVDARDRLAEAKDELLALGGIPVAVIKPLAGDPQVRLPVQDEPAVSTEPALSSGTG